VGAETLEQRIQRVLKEDIAIVPYDSRWPELFREEKEHLLAVLPKELIQRIEHFGSTAVLGLGAKPIVDMLVEVTDLGATRERIAPVLEAEGYDYFWRATFGDDVPPFYAWFIKRDRPGGVRTHHIHMIEASFTEHWNSLLFRDYLIRHPETAREYGRLKLRLAAEYAHDRIAYTAGKSEFIASVMQLAKKEMA
jgi:GrpB-like predicted nucleotidyltransferase (UPF0157 family)